MRIAEVAVTRSEHHRAEILVGAWEILMLQYEHEPEKVEILGFKKVPGREYPDPRQEFERLSIRYGIDVESNAPKAALVYGQGALGVQALRNLIEQERKAESEETLEPVALTSNVVENPPAPAVPAPAVPEVIPARPTLGLPKSKDAAA